MFKSLSEYMTNSWLYGKVNETTKDNKDEQKYDEFKERIQKRSEYAIKDKEHDKIRQIFAHSNYTEDEIIEDLEKHQVNVNEITSSFVLGIFHPVFFWMGNKPKVLEYFIEKKKIDPSRKMDISIQNPYHHDFLDWVPEDSIPSLVQYGFGLTTGTDYCKKYFNIYNINRLQKFTETGLIEYKAIEKCATEEYLKKAIFETHQANSISLESGSFEFGAYNSNLQSILKVYSDFDKFSVMDINKLKNKLKSKWHFLEWELIDAKEFLSKHDKK